MFHSNFVSFAVLLVLTLSGLTAVPAPAHAARPMMTDDARIVDPRSCQIESWSRFLKNGWEGWALPGCNPVENLEITAGGAHLNTRVGDDAATTLQLQGKTIFRRLEDDDWGYGLAIGTVRRRSPGSNNEPDNPYFYLPISVAFAQDKVVIHINAGAARQAANHQTLVTWGLGSETRLANRLQLIAEVYGDDRSGAFHHLGLRWWVVPNRVQLDTTYGDRFGSQNGERWFSVGLRLLSPAFIP
jgi:hypothetical protein